LAMIHASRDAFHLRCDLGTRSLRQNPNNSLYMRLFRCNSPVFTTGE
jgi:hypothetical protein